VKRIPFFVILNMEIPERIHHVVESMKMYPYDEFVIINAVIPKTINSFIISKRINIEKGNYQSRKLACYLSHYKALYQIVSFGIPDAIIIEDDFVLNKDYIKDIENVKSEIPENTDVVRLYSVGNIIPIQDKKYIGKVDRWGDVGNYVTRKGALLLLDFFKNIKYEQKFNGVIPNDFLLTELGEKNKITIFNSIKKIVDTEGDVEIDKFRRLGTTIHHSIEMMEIR